MNLDIIEYLNSNGIIVGEENFPRIKNKKKEWNVKNQISLIIEVQKILKGKKSYIIPRIESSIGHEIESFIVQTKRISKMIKLYEEKYYKDDFDYFIIEEGNKILANGNLYVIELDEDKINPYFLKAYLESENGKAALSRVAVGATLLNLPVEGLKKITIPLPDLKSQKIIADKYYAKINEIKELKYKLEKATAELEHIYMEEK